MTPARVAISHLSDREIIDRERQCTWIEDVATLHNDVRFKPVPVNVLAGRVTRDALCGIDNSGVLHKNRSCK